MVRRLLAASAVLAAGTLFYTLWPYSGRSLGALSSVPDSFLEFQRLTVSALVVLGWGGACAVFLFLRGISGRNAMRIALFFLVLSVSAYSQWWLQPLAFLHGLPYVSLPNAVLWMAALAVAYLIALLMRTAVAHPKAATATITAYAGYAVLVLLLAGLLLYPLSRIDAVPSPSVLKGEVSIMWEVELPEPAWNVSMWHVDPANYDLYIMSGNQAMRIDLRTGEPIWSTTLALEKEPHQLLFQHVAMASDEESLFIVHHSKHGLACRLNKQDGEIMWEVPLSFGHADYSSGASAFVRCTKEKLVVLRGFGEGLSPGYYVIDHQSGNLSTVDVITGEQFVWAMPPEVPVAYEWVSSSEDSLALHLYAHPERTSTHESRDDWSGHGWLVMLCSETALPLSSCEAIGLCEPYAAAAMAVDSCGAIGPFPSANGSAGFVYLSYPDLRERWRIGLSSSYSRVWLLEEHAIITETPHDTCIIHLVTRQTGEHVWKAAFPEADAHLVLAGKSTCVFIWNRGLLALSLVDGSIVWQEDAVDTQEPGYRASVTSVYDTDNGIVLGIQEWFEKSHGRISYLLLDSGREANIGFLDRPVEMHFDGYLAMIGASTNTWHPVLGMSATTLKLSGTATRPWLQYAGAQVSGITQFGIDLRIFGQDKKGIFAGPGAYPGADKFELLLEKWPMRIGDRLFVFTQDALAQKSWITCILNP